MKEIRLSTSFWTWGIFSSGIWSFPEMSSADHFLDQDLADILLVMQQHVALQDLEMLCWRRRCSSR